MRSFAYLTLLSIASALTLVTESSNAEVSGKGISSIHEGAGINYFLVGTTANGEDLTYADNQLSSQAGSLTYRVSKSGDFLANSVLEPSTVDISSGYAKIDGQTDFFACKNVNDPYNYSQDSYAVVTSKQNDECVDIKLKVVGGETSSSAAPSSSAVPTAPYGNTTVTTQYTVTDYTTYCPEHTTVTITTCSDNKCAPHVVTVESATTLTVTGECLVTESPAPVTTEAPTTVATSAEQSSTIAPISTFVNGGSRIGAVGGLAALGFLLL